MTRYEHLTCADFERRLRLLSTSIEQRDPNRIDFSLRVGIAQSLFLFHDELRCREEPFDRSAFATRLEQAVTAVERSESSIDQLKTPVVGLLTRSMSRICIHAVGLNMTMGHSSIR